MASGQKTEISEAEHTAPREAWDRIADGYDRYVAPQEAELASEALALVELSPENGSSTSRPGRAG